MVKYEKSYVVEKLPCSKIRALKIIQLMFFLTNSSIVIKIKFYHLEVTNYLGGYLILAFSLRGPIAQKKTEWGSVLFMININALPKT